MQIEQKEKEGPSEHTAAILTCCMPMQDDLAFVKSRGNELNGSPGRVLIVEKRKAEAPAEAGGSGERSSWSVLWTPSRLEPGARLHPPTRHLGKHHPASWMRLTRVVRWTLLLGAQCLGQLQDLGPLLCWCRLMEKP
jgi:hypothetical protein